MVVRAIFLKLLNNWLDLIKHNYQQQKYRFVTLKFMKEKKQLTVDMISVECVEGKHRSTSMTECESCSLGKEPNDDKDDCGKKT